MSKNRNRNRTTNTGQRQFNVGGIFAPDKDGKMPSMARFRAEVNIQDFPYQCVHDPNITVKFLNMFNMTPDEVEELDEKLKLFDEATYLTDEDISHFLVNPEDIELIKKDNLTILERVYLLVSMRHYYTFQITALGEKLGLNRR